jgi:hypothetical protein
MKSIIVVSSILMFFHFGSAYACSIQDRKSIQIGANRGIAGVCSNNGSPISCENRGNDEISCDGPGGGYSGYDLESLVFSACGCSSQEEKGKQLEQELKENKPSGTS